MASGEDVKVEEERIRNMHGMLHARALSLFPTEFRQHMLAARREMLLAMRSLIDVRLEMLERAEQNVNKKATKVSVE